MATFLLILTAFTWVLVGIQGALVAVSGFDPFVVVMALFTLSMAVLTTLSWRLS